MSTMTRTLGLLLLIYTAGAGVDLRAASARPAGAAEPPAAPLAPPKAAEAPEPPPAPLQVEPAEPAPAPLVEDKTPAPSVQPTSARPLAPLQTAPPAPPSPRAYTVAAWSGVALTLAFVAAGTTLGILAQNRSDALSRQTGQIVEGLPPVYDAAQHDEYTRLQDQGASFNRGTTVCLLLAGVSAVATGFLFWDRQRLFGKELVLAPSLSTTTTAQSGSLTLAGRF